MKTLHAAFAIWLGCCSGLAAGSSGDAEPWTTRASADFRKAFELQTGRRFDRARWYRQWYQPSADDRQVIAIGSGAALAAAEPAGPRLKKGLAYDFFKSAPAGDRGWMPGEPFEWKWQGAARPYALVSPPQGDPDVEKRPRWAKRIFDQPIFVDAGLSDAEVVALVDFCWSSLVRSAKARRSDAEERPAARAFQIRPPSGPPWENLAELRRVNSLQSVAEAVRRKWSGCVALVFSFEKAGSIGVVVTKADACWRVVNEFEMDY